MREIQRAAEHPTRMTEIIREAVKLVPTSEKLDDQCKAITRRLWEAEKKIKNFTSAMATGGGSVRPLLNMLDDLEGPRISLDTERQRLERQIADTRLQRPDTGHVRALWGKFTELWGSATEGERSELMPLLVERVEMHEKERGFCRLWFSLQNPRPRDLATSSNAVIRSQMGAVVPPITTNPQFFNAPVFVPMGGQNRTKLPRPCQQPIHTV